MHSISIRLRIFLLALLARNIFSSDGDVTSMTMAVARSASEGGAVSSPVDSYSGGESKRPLERSLRGGSYSRGGSSYHSGGSSYHSGGSGYHNYNGHSSSSSSSNHNNNNSYSYRRNGTSSMGSFWRGLAFAGLGLAFMWLICGTGAACLPLLCCCCGAQLAAGAAASTLGTTATGSSTGNRYVNTAGDVDDRFRNRVRRAKGEVENASRAARGKNGPRGVQPFSGQYTTSFVDPESGTRHNASISIFFTPESLGNGYRINGQGSDIDGNTVIEDGFANHDGSAWWVEKNITGDLSLRVLSGGKFDFCRRTFEGTWLANTMLGGPYLSFAGVQTFDSYQSQSKIPIVVATPIPTPEPSAPPME